MKGILKKNSYKINENKDYLPVKLFLALLCYYQLFYYKAISWAFV